MRVVAPVFVLAGVLAAGAVVSGQDAFTNWIRPDFGDKELRSSYEAMYYFDADVARQNRALRFTQHDWKLSFPVFQNERHEWQVSAGLNAWDIDTRARFPNTFEHLPNTLWDLRVGTTYRHRFENGWIAGGNLTIGSPSDRPFASGDEFMVDFTGLLRIEPEKGPPWVFLLNYANVRERYRHIPLVGFGVQFESERLAPGLEGMVGVPFNAVEWEPNDRLRVEAMYLMPRTVHAKVFYRIFEPLRVHAGFDWSNQVWLRRDRRHVDDQLTYYEKRVLAGLEWTVTENVTLDLGGGFAWDRFLYEGEDYGDRGDNRLDIHDGWIARLELRIRM